MSEPTLRVVTIDPKAGAKAEVVKMAKAILRMAEAGDLVDLSFFGTTRDECIRTGMTSTDDQHRRLAACSRLLHRLHMSADADCD